MQYRKKPIVVEAIRWKGILPSDASPVWFNDAFVFDRIYMLKVDGVAVIKTLEGVMTASIGDWIIRGIKGELYPCKHDIFLETYELVEE